MRPLQLIAVAHLSLVGCTDSGKQASGNSQKVFEHRAAATIVGTWRTTKERNVPLDIEGREEWSNARDYSRTADFNVVTFNVNGTWVGKAGRDGPGPRGRTYDYDHGTYALRGNILTKKSVDGFTQTLKVEVLDDQNLVLRWRYSDFHDYAYYERVR